MPSITFADLEVVANDIVGRAGSPTTDLSLTAPREKISKNGLEGSTFLIEQGMLQARTVADYLAAMETIGSGIAERLRAGFVSQYEVLHAQGLRDDALFEALVTFAQGDGGLSRRAAGLAITVYLFEACEIFER